MQTQISRQKLVKRPAIAGAALLIILLLLAAWLARPLWQPAALPGNIPEFSLDHAEAPVAAKLQTLRQSVLTNPGSAAAWGKLAMNLDVHDLKAPAIHCYQQAANLDKSAFRWPYYCAIAMQEIGSPDAIAWFERSLALRPDYGPLLVLYGRALHDAGELGRAAEMFRQALTLDSTAAHARLGLARLAFARGEIEKSREHALQALATNPRFREAHGLLAELYRQDGAQERAEQHLRLARRLPAITPLDDSLYVLLAQEGVSSRWHQSRGRAYLEKGMPAPAAEQFRLALAIKPDAEAHNNLGVALQAQGDYEAAMAQHRQAIALNPKLAEAHNNLATALLELGHTDGAVAPARAALALQPDFAAAHLNLGTAHWRAGRLDSAITAFRTGLQRAPENPRLAQRLAWLLATAPEPALRDGSEAERLAQALCRQTGHQVPELLDLLAAAQAEQQQYEAAAASARRAVELARGAGRDALAAQIQSRLHRYQSHQPYRENLFGKE